ncbi:MAG: hypothetical protein H6974_11745 [Gammaproteobacteria bacterium]|nr:hypothetical protein [Gammaproteobacteria bacterium]
MSVQVWELMPHLSASTHDADDDTAALVVAVFLKGRGIDRWKSMPAGFEAAVAHYQRVAAQENLRRANPVTRPPVATGAEHAAVAA